MVQARAVGDGSQAKQVLRRGCALPALLTGLGRQKKLTNFILFYLITVDNQYSCIKT